MRVSAISWRAMLAISAWTVSAQVLGATVMVSGVTFDPSNGTTQASIVSGGYATPFGLALSSRDRLRKACKIQRRLSFQKQFSHNG